MLPQKVHDQQKAALMEATVKAIVADGVENLTTRSIGVLSGVNEVYIYRYFENKEDLVSKTFSYCDERFLRCILENFPVMSCDSLDYETRCRVLFKKCWDYIMQYPDWLIFYVRYYYSSTFQKYSYAEHMERYSVLNEKMRPICHPDAEVPTVLHHILDTLLSQARKQITHPQDPDQAANDTFYLLFSVIKGGNQLDL